MMKISCDLCGSELQMEAGGQSARCTVCGMVYSLERLREKILGRGAVFRGVGAHKPNRLLGKVLLLLFRRRRGEFSFKAV